MAASSSRTTKILIVAGCAGLGAATFLFIKYLQQQSRLNIFQEELDKLKKDVEDVRKEVRQLSEKDAVVSSGVTNALRAESRENTSDESSEESGSAEYYDAVEDLMTPLDCEVVEKREEAYNLVKDTLAKRPQAARNCGFLWRCARATYLYGQSYLNTDDEKRKKLIFEAKNWAFDALELNDTDPDVHKWCALTLGTTTEFLGLNEKIQKGYQFKAHIDRALDLRPEDPILHHLCGRWCLEVANLSWIERKVASALFSEPPTSSYEEALHYFLEAERLLPDTWADNLMHIGKVYLAMGQTERATSYFRKTLKVPAKDPDDIAAQDEAKFLLSKY